MVMIPMPTSFMPNSVPKAATAQSRYGPLMQTLMAKQAAMQKGTMPKVAAPKVAAPQLAVQKPPMPMSPAPTDAGPMPSDWGIPAWRRLAPGPERDAAYARYMNAQSAPTAPQPVAPANAGTPAWTQYMGDLTGPQPVASGPAANSLPLGSGFNVTLPKVTPDMFSSAPAAPQPVAPANAGTPAWTQYMGDITGPQPAASGSAPNSLPLGSGFNVTLPQVAPNMFSSAPTMPQSFMPQPVMPKSVMPQPVMPQPAVAPQPQYGPRMLSLMAKQRAAAQPMPAPQGMAMGGLMDKYYGGGEC